MPPQTKYPCDDVSLKNLPGERWNEVPGYEEFYQVSTHGRIKSLPRPREVIHNKSHEIFTYWTKERIRKIKIHEKWNSVVNETYYECTVSLFMDGNEKSLLVPRLVYQAFRGELNFENDRLMIMHKNGNGLDNHYTNLAAGSRSEVLEKAYRRNRHISPFKLKTKKELKEIRNRAGISRQKKVMQYSLEGKYIHTYDSILEASLNVGTPDTNILRVLKGQGITAAGFIWRYFINPPQR